METLAVQGAFFLGGLALGMYFNYIVETKPLLRDYRDLITIIYKMKRQGFVPQFDIRQRKPIDPAKDVVEY